MKFHFKNFRQKKGAILIEVLISLIVFTIGVVGSLGLLMASDQANVSNRNRTIALNLAQEALEVVRNIRDTNWMVYSSNLRECWNFSPDVDENGKIDGSDGDCISVNGQNQHSLGIGENAPAANYFRMRSFIVDFDATNFRWLILPASQYINGGATTFEPYNDIVKNGDPLGLDGSTEYSSIDTADNRTPRLSLDENGRYTHLPTGTSPSIFHRIIDICYIDNVDPPPDPNPDGIQHDCNDSGLFPDGVKSKDNRIQITARVYFKENPSDEKFKSLSLQTFLTDYLERENWDE